MKHTYLKIFNAGKNGESLPAVGGNLTSNTQKLQNGIFQPGEEKEYDQSANIKHGGRTRYSFVEIPGKGLMQVDRDQQDSARDNGQVKRGYSALAYDVDNDNSFRSEDLLHSGLSGRELARRANLQFPIMSLLGEGYKGTDEKGTSFYQTPLDFKFPEFPDFEETFKNDFHKYSPAQWISALFKASNLSNDKLPNMLYFDPYGATVFKNTKLTDELLQDKILPYVNQHPELYDAPVLNHKGNIKNNFELLLNSFVKNVEEQAASPNSFGTATSFVSKANKGKLQKAFTGGYYGRKYENVNSSDLIDTEAFDKVLKEFYPQENTTELHKRMLSPVLSSLKAGEVSPELISLLDELDKKYKTGKYSDFMSKPNDPNYWAEHFLELLAADEAIDEGYFRNNNSLRNLRSALRKYMKIYDDKDRQDYLKDLYENRENAFRDKKLNLMESEEPVSKEDIETGEWDPQRDILEEVQLKKAKLLREVPVWNYVQKAEPEEPNFTNMSTDLATTIMRWVSNNIGEEATNKVIDFFSSPESFKIIDLIQKDKIGKEAISEAFADIFSKMLFEHSQGSIRKKVSLKQTIDRILEPYFPGAKYSFDLNGLIKDWFPFEGSPRDPETGQEYAPTASDENIKNVDWDHDGIIGNLKDMYLDKRKKGFI